MKSAVTIFLLGILVSIQTPMGQLFKIPFLFQHYIRHQEQQGVSFIDFLKEHYSSDHNDADLPEDNQLPFKNITFNSIDYAIVKPFNSANVFTSLPAGKKIIFPDIYTPQQHLVNIFHPPRV